MFLAVHYQVMEHLGSLESTQEARVALSYRLGQLLRFFRALQTCRVFHNSMVHVKAWTNCLIAKKMSWLLMVIMASGIATATAAEFPNMAAILQNLGWHTTYKPRVGSLQGNLRLRPWCTDRAIARSIHQGRGLRFPCNDRPDEVNKLLIIYGLFSLILKENIIKTLEVIFHILLGTQEVSLLRSY